MTRPFVATIPLVALLLLAVPACDGDDDTEPDSDWVVAWCDLMDDEAVCVNLLNPALFGAFRNELCPGADGTVHTSGECPREGAVGACTGGGMEYLYFEDYPEDDLAVEATTCTDVGGTWVDF